MVTTSAIRSLRNCALVISISTSFACDRFGGDDKPAEAKKEESKPEEKPKKDEKTEKKATEKTAAVKKEPEKVAEKVEDVPPPKAVAKEPLAYVPEQAKLVLVADPKALSRSSLFSGSGSFVEKMGDSRVGEVYAAAETCNIGVSAWSSVLIAGDGDSEEDLVVVARATNIGKKETIECLSTKINAIAGEGKWIVSEDAGRPVFDVEGKNTRGIGAADDVLVVTGKGYATAVGEILDGKGKSAADGALGKMLASVDKSKHVYFVGEPPPDMQQGGFGEVKQISGTLDFSSGLAMTVAFDFVDVSKATEIGTTWQGLFEGMKESLAGTIPPGVLASVKIEVKETKVSARASASNAEVETIIGTLQTQL